MMKSVLVAAVFCLFGITAQAADIILSAGSKAYIKAGEAAVVACEGSSSESTLPACSIINSDSYGSSCGSGYTHQVNISGNSKFYKCASSLDDAILSVDGLRKARLCK